MGQYDRDLTNVPLQPDVLPSPKGMAASIIPPTTPHHTVRGRMAQHWGWRNLPPGLLQEAIDRYRAAEPRFTLGNSNYFNARKQTILCCASAIAYARAGMRVIDLHGLRDDGTCTGRSPKHPRGSQWQIRGTDVEEDVWNFFLGIGDYPTDKHGEIYPYASIWQPRGVGILTGPNETWGNIIGFDEDGAGGRKSLADLKARNGDFPTTPCQTTGRENGGRQWLFRAPADLDFRNTAGQMGDGLDARGRGGYVVAGPSQHPTGLPYLWMDGLAPHQVEPAMIPDWVADLVRSASKITGGDTVRSAAKRPNADRKARVAKGDVPAWVIDASDDVEAPEYPTGFENRVALIGDGEGRKGFNTPVYKAACSWWAREGTDADAQVLFDILIAAIESAPMNSSRDATRYSRDNGSELWRQINRAQEWALDNL